MGRAVACSSVADDETVPTMPPTARSNPSAIWRMPVALRDSSEAEIRACVRLLGRLKTRLQPLADPLAAESRVPPRLVAAE